ncbi:MAG: KEOPS complex subunit Cgi121 [Candidatus Bathyarchaeia archaeon]
MLKRLEEFGKHVLIAGFKGAKILVVEDFLKTVKSELGAVEVVFANAELIATWQHLYFAVLNALNAFKSGYNISKNLAVEVLLYASAQRQIRKAVEVLGIKPATSEIAVVIINGDAHKTKLAISKIAKIIGGRRDDSILELSAEKIKAIRSFFGISELELEAVMGKSGLEEAIIKLVLERVALLAVQR